MTTSAILIDRRRIKLGARLGKGGEGEVYSLEHDESHAVKLYTVSDLNEREHKVEAMIRTGMARQVPQVAFPLRVVRDEAGKFAGFLMRNVLEHKPLHELYSPGSRKLHFPQADYRFLVRTAQNISKAIASVHAIDCVIGDINQSSILVSKAATVALIDSDSFQVTSGSEKFLCRVGVPEYTPPELQGASLSKVARTPNHDAFGLAIVIFQLLFMGRHPFVGSVRRGDIPALHDSIKEFRFVYTEERDVGMDQPPGTPALSDFPRTVARAFESAFGRTTLEARPSAQVWIEVLAELEKSLIQCSYDKLHWYPVEASECPWCAMERELGAMLFAPSDPSERAISPFDPGAGGFNLSTVWRQISSFNLQRLNPALPQAPVRVTAIARLAKWRGRAYIAKLRRRYFDVEQEWLAAESAWRARTGVAAIESLFEELRSARASYENLPSEERAQLDAYERDRRERQLLAFLGRYEIRRAILRGIGPPEEATLASFGIETAGDIVDSKLLRVPGLAPESGTALIEWRKRLEKQFVYDAKENDIDRQELARIRANVEHQAAFIRRTLLAGRSNLDAAVGKLGNSLASVDSKLANLHQLRLQLRAELECLGLDLSTLSALAANSNQLAMAGARVTSSASATSWPRTPAAGAAPEGSIRCPRCGSPMVRRITKHHGSAGQQFWGCSRHPLCKGIRNSTPGGQASQRV
jgi:DNA-binding helix-hairpin-helix protein with protein kinase domain